MNEYWLKIHEGVLAQIKEKLKLPNVIAQELAMRTTKQLKKGGGEVCKVFEDAKNGSRLFIANEWSMSDSSIFPLSDEKIKDSTNGAYIMRIYATHHCVKGTMSAPLIFIEKKTPKK